MFRISKQLLSTLFKRKTPLISLSPNIRIFNQTIARFSETIPKPLEKVHEFKFNDDWNQILSTKGPLVVDFYANWCGPCKRLMPVLTQKAKSMTQKWNLVLVNIDEFPDIAESFQVQAVPTVVLLKDGKVEEKFVGFPADDKLNAFFAKANGEK